MLLVGTGRVGTALLGRARARGVDLAGVGRGEAWPDGRPILVTTRADDLPAVLDGCPAERRAELVFVQNGMIRPWLAGRGLGGATRGLLYFAVPRRGDDLVPGGPSPFCGPWAEAVVALLRRLDVPATTVEPAAFARLEAEKLLWNTVCGLLSEVLERPVGELPPAEVRALVDELAPLLEGPLGVALDPAALAEGMLAYSASVAGWRGAVREWPWRNGWFVDEARRRGVPTPRHAAWLARRAA